MTPQEVYPIYRKAIDAMKVEVGYQEMRKQILTKTLPTDIYVMDTNFQTKCRKADRGHFHDVWFPKVLKALQTYSCVIGTITCLPKTKEGEGHYMCIMFTQGKYSKDRSAYLFDPSNATHNSARVYNTQLVIQHLTSMLAYWKFPVHEFKTNYTCQIVLHAQMNIPIHVDTYCQTWSLLLAIEHFKRPTFFSAFPFKKDDIESLKMRHDLFIIMIRRYILPHLDREMLEKTFQTQLLTNGLRYNGSAYDILMGAVWNDHSYFFFRDTPYAF